MSESKAVIKTKEININEINTNEGSTVGRLRRQLNPMLVELIAGCFAFEVLGVVFILALLPLWYEGSIGKTLLGFTMGVLLMVGFVIHMYLQIEQSFDFNEAGAIRHNIKMFAIRAGIVLVLTGVLCYTGFCNAVAFVCGMISLKVAAYLQPFTHRVLIKLNKGR